MIMKNTVVKMRKSFITTPIFYVNGPPHLGHLYTSLLADAQHRYQLLRSTTNETHIFSTGTDEHGLKVEQAALQSNKGTNNTSNQNIVKSYCDTISSQFSRLMTSFSVSNTHFVRTTDQRHFEAVSKFWERLEKKDLIYSSNYEGWYSVADETFVPSSQVTDRKLESGENAKIFSETGHVVQWTSEKNYMFRLSQFRKDIQKWIQTENPIQPTLFLPMVMKWLESCQDLSISRPRSRLTWGIPVPNDSSQTIYVWLDALVNYLTAVGYPSDNYLNYWPPTTQLVGKDILKFHAIYWPGFLLAAEMELPRKILCHSHWTVNNVKMSKSLGNVVDPFSLMDKYGAEPVRYFLLREGLPHSDGNFNEPKMIQMANVELADTLGNLLSRSSSRALNPKQIWPKFNDNDISAFISPHGRNLMKAVEELPGKVEGSFEDFNFYRGIENIMTVLRLANLFVQEEQPWKLVKISPREPALLGMTCLVLETLRVCGIILQPIVPNLSSILLDKLNVPLSHRQWSNIKPFCWEECFEEDRQLDNQNLILFSRIKT